MRELVLFLLRCVVLLKLLRLNRFFRRLQMFHFDYNQSTPQNHSKTFRRKCPLETSKVRCCLVVKREAEVRLRLSCNPNTY